MWGYFWGDNVLSPTSSRCRMRVGVRDGHDCFSKLSLCLPTHRLEREGRGGREGPTRMEFNRCYFDRTQENRPKVHLIVQQSLYTSHTMLGKLL
jgi:hypothetical protein